MFLMGSRNPAVSADRQVQTWAFQGVLGKRSRTGRHVRPPAPGERIIRATKIPLPAGATRAGSNDREPRCCLTEGKWCTNDDEDENWSITV